jgi:predicted transposase YdaD
MMSLRTVFREKLAQQKQEGIQEGIQQEINLVIRLLKSKIGNLAPELERQVRNLPLDKLEDLGVALLKFESVKDLIVWLQTN